MKLLYKPCVYLSKQNKICVKYVLQIDVSDCLNLKNIKKMLGNKQDYKLNYNILYRVNDQNE